MSPRTSLIFLLTMGSGLSLLAGCDIDGGAAAGRRCATANDCPAPLVCVQVRPGGRTCEAVAGPVVGDFDVDAGTASWCEDVRPVMDTHCINCHGSPPSGGAPANFRLDQYGPDTSGTEGAAAMAERIYVRMAVTKDMPPPGYPDPTEAELLAVTAWYRTGAPECPEGPDAGMSPDAGP